MYTNKGHLYLKCLILSSKFGNNEILFSCLAHWQEQASVHNLFVGVSAVHSGQSLWQDNVSSRGDIDYLQYWQFSRQHITLLVAKIRLSFYLYKSCQGSSYFFLMVSLTSG